MPEFEDKAAVRRFFFRKENRVLKRADYQKVYNQGRVLRRPLVHVFVMAPVSDDSNGIIAPTRLGITATKKSGKAVYRNRGRRLVRESFRLMLPDLKPGYSIVVNVMRAATTAPFQKVDTQLRDIFEQADLFSSGNRPETPTDPPTNTPVN